MLIDMPLEELKRYQGRNPKPADYDEFWARSLAELEAIPPDIEMTPSAFQTPYAECFDLYFTGTGGARIYAKFSRPRNDSLSKPGVVVFHGYGGDSYDWCGLLPFVAANFVVAALDCRGQGGRSEDCIPVKGNTLNGHIIRGAADADPRKLYFRNVFLDTVRLTKILMSQPDVDPTRIGATGGSQGGGLSFACAGLVPEVKCVAGAFPFLCDYQRVWEMDLANNAYRDITEYFRHFDRTHAREKEFFTKLGYVDVQFLAPRIRGKALMLTGLMDTICPPSTQFAMFNKIRSEKELILYPDFGHEGLPDWDDIKLQWMLKELA
ncbi:alpha/beta fold hydrolase [Victivallis sp. Marseille-Q1083]|uniref:acetylxylan esterase n=1 Tax=Victivallis sp. Marseille-Q1083 TaxID=2717288 RepID=UPI001588FE90|nr:alpha/beta fold hydrolase [Victivallis sp. Marseille-Q1083]